MTTPGTFGDAERAVSAMMDLVNAAISDVHEALSNPAIRVACMDARADRMFETARCRPLGATPVLLGAARAQLRRGKEAMATSRALVRSSVARIAETRARLERFGRCHFPP